MIDFIVEFCKHLEVPDQDLKYTASQSGEVKAEFFPHFPILILFKRPLYDKRSSKKDKDAWDTLCTKLFPVHSQLMPGLFIVSCCNPQKKVYGFKKMV